MSVTDLSSRLILDHRGIWRVRETEDVSYPETGNQTCFQLEDDSFWFRHRNACLVSMVERFQPGGPIVDVGGGNGFVSRALIDAGFDCILLEPGPTGALNAKAHREIPDVICSTLKGASLEPSSVAAVGLFDVLEHIQDDAEMVTDLARVLTADGLFYGTVPAYPWLWSNADHVAQHHRRYTRASLDQLLAREFEVLYSTYFFRALTLPIYLMRSLPFKLGLTKRESLMAVEAEHGTDSGLGARLLSRLLAREFNRLERGVSQRWGASLLFAARKRS